MAKKNSFIGNLIALTATVATIGGVCYIFRDKIKESDVYKKSTDKLSNLRNKMCDNCSDDEDFYFDDDFEDDLFSDDAKKNREYTSITINSKETSESKKVNIGETIEDEITETTDEDEDKNILSTDTEITKDNTESEKDKEQSQSDMKKSFAEDGIPTISFGNIKPSQQSTDNTTSKEDDAKEVLGYENEGLSDVYEDPDVLADTDKLDY